jgi:transcriptional regulator with XRE-family HTH domain
MVGMATKTRPEFSLGDRMRKAREAAGLEQSDICKALRFSRSSASSWENGRATPRSYVIEQWADLTGVDLEWLDPEHDIRSRCSDREAS